MKNKIIMVFLLCLTSSIATSQTFQSNKPVTCSQNPEQMIKSLVEKYHEEPVWTATGEGSNFTLLINKDTPSWTLIQYTREWVCVIGAGDDSNFLPGKDTIWHRQKDSNLRLPRS